MISPELAARIRRLHFAEHWKVGTICSELVKGAVSAPAVAHLLEQRARRQRQPPPLAGVLPDDPRIAASRTRPTP